jgi:hypothetical protein
MASTFDTQFVATAVPALFAEFGESIGYFAPDPLSVQGVHGIVNLGTAAQERLSERGLLVATADALVEVAASEFTPALEGYFTLAGGDYAIIVPPVLENGVWLCVCRRRATLSWGERRQESGNA